MPDARHDADVIFIAPTGLSCQRTSDHQGRRTCQSRVALRELSRPARRACLSRSLGLGNAPLPLRPTVAITHRKNGISDTGTQTRALRALAGFGPALRTHHASAHGFLSFLCTPHIHTIPGGPRHAARDPNQQHVTICTLTLVLFGTAIVTLQRSHTLVHVSCLMLPTLHCLLLSPLSSLVHLLFSFFSFLPPTVSRPRALA